ncbi:hypothetical protein CCP3SC5AM1_1920003 [Gammaproteobacteria bacterium]
MATETLVEAAAVMTPAQRLAKVNKLVRNYSIGSVAPSLIPVPILDLVALTSLQIKMLHSLSNIYKVPFSKNLGKEAIGGLLGGVVPVSMTPMTASLIKVVPFVGQVAGTVSMATLGGASTYAIGKIFIQHFESGGTFLNFDPEKVREYFASALEEGKKVVNETQATTSSTEARA